MNTQWDFFFGPVAVYVDLLNLGLGLSYSHSTKTGILILPCVVITFGRKNRLHKEVRTTGKKCGTLFVEITADSTQIEAKIKEVTKLAQTMRQEIDRATFAAWQFRKVTR